MEEANPEGFGTFRLEECDEKSDEMCLHKTDGFYYGFFPDPDVFAYILSKIIDDGEIIIAMIDDDDMWTTWGYKVRKNEVTRLIWEYAEEGKMEKPYEEAIAGWVDEKKLEEVAKQ